MEDIKSASLCTLTLPSYENQSRHRGSSWTQEGIPLGWTHSKCNKIPQTARQDFGVLNCEWESWEWAISVCDCHWSRHYTITNTHNNRCTYISNDENHEEHKGKQSVTYWLRRKAQYEGMQSGAKLSQHWHHQNHRLVHYTNTRLWLTAGKFYLPIQYAKNYVTFSFDSNLNPHKAMVYCTERCFWGNCFSVMS